MGCSIHNTVLYTVQYNQEHRKTNCRLRQPGISLQLPDDPQLPVGAGPDARSSGAERVCSGQTGVRSNAAATAARVREGLGLRAAARTGKAVRGPDWPTFGNTRSHDNRSRELAAACRSGPGASDGEQRSSSVP